jgi:ubiquinone/menaquinone biosynthesis C-methylase UbiE
MTAGSDWNQASGAWDAARDFVETMKAELTAAMIAGLALSPGAAVLELGAGTGALAAQLADAVGPEGRVLATDLAPGMVELVQREAGDRPQLSAVVADAAATGCDADSFDAAASRMLLMLLPDPKQALSEWHRVLRPGGRLAVAVWDAPEHNTWLVAVGMSAMIHGAVAGGPPTEPGGVFSLGSADELSALVENAGFHSVQVQTVAMKARFTSADAHFATISAMAAPLGKAIAAASPEVLAAIKATTAEIIAPFHTDDGDYVIPAQALLCTAVA